MACVHAAWSCRCVVSDTAEYSAVATNQHGTATSKATVTVKSKSSSFFASVLLRLYSPVVFLSVIRVFFSSQEQQEPGSPASLV